VNSQVENYVQIMTPTNPYMIPPISKQQSLKMALQVCHSWTNKKRYGYWNFGTLRPRGLATPLKNSRCASSSCLVRSPTHSIWAEQSYHSPEVESSLVSACSYGSSKHSWDVQNSVEFITGWSTVRPQEDMNLRASSTLWAISIYLKHICISKNRRQEYVDAFRKSF